MPNTAVLAGRHFKHYDVLAPVSGSRVLYLCRCRHCGGCFSALEHRLTRKLMGCGCTAPKLRYPVSVVHKYPSLD